MPEAREQFLADKDGCATGRFAHLRSLIVLAVHHAKYRLVEMMERIIDVVSAAHHR